MYLYLRACSYTTLCFIFPRPIQLSCMFLFLLCSQAAVLHWIVINTKLTRANNNRIREYIPHMQMYVDYFINWKEKYVHVLFYVTNGQLTTMHRQYTDTHNIFSLCVNCQLKQSQRENWTLMTMYILYIYQKLNEWMKTKANTTYLYMHIKRENKMDITLLCDTFFIKLYIKES